MSEDVDKVAGEGGEDLRTIVIAEAGVNHNGSLETAKKMVAAAAVAGADYVKFQTFHAVSLVRTDSEKAEYQKRNTGTDLSQFEMLEALELNPEDFIELEACCKRQGIGFLSSPFDIPSLNFLDGLNMDYLKIPSGELTNYPYLIEAAHSGKPILLSTGMATLAEIEATLALLRKNGSGEITLLQCNTDYPTSYSDVHLRAMVAMGEHYEIPVGYSDHTLGAEAALAAVALGACVIEKHFTLDRTMPGPDHCISLEPKEMQEMIESIRRVEACLGGRDKAPTFSELKNRSVVRKSIVAAGRIRRGEPLTVENLTTKRPGLGLDPMLWPKVVGTLAIRDFEKDEYIEL